MKIPDRHEEIESKYMEWEDGVIEALQLEDIDLAWKYYLAIVGMLETLIILNYTEFASDISKGHLDLFRRIVFLDQKKEKKKIEEKGGDHEIN